MYNGCKKSRQICIKIAKHQKWHNWKIAEKNEKGFIKNALMTEIVFDHSTFICGLK